MPGCGKSTLARALADAGLAECIDIDAIIEQETGRTVADIISRDGDAAFRSLERHTLERIARRAEGRLPAVVSTGGGAPCFGANMDLMLDSGTVVWLRAGRERTLQRLEEARGRRPAADRAMASGRLAGWYDDLLAGRKVYYARAHSEFDTTELDDAAAIAAAVARFASAYLSNLKH